jgi:type II secretory pathway pseudopilin PulG
MDAVRSKRADALNDERGFTLPGLLTMLAILGILIAIAAIIFLADLEHWRVNAATKQPVGGLWHSHATDRLRDWRGVLTLDRTEQEGPLFYLIKQAGPYGGGDPRPALSGQVSGCTQILAAQVILRYRMW